MPQITATSTPQDVYTLATISPNNKVQIQNKSPRQLMIYAGDSAPVKLDDYFIADPWVWAEYQGTVIMLWAEYDTPVMVQDVS